MTGRRFFWGALLIVFGCGSSPRPPAEPNSAAKARARRPDSPYVAALHAKLGAESELSLVPSLQAAAEDALTAAGTAGAVVALDPNDGSVLALYSVPGDRGDPLLTPALPASTFKSFAALAALRTGVITPETVLTCNGGYDFEQRLHLSCPLQHGPENVAHALAVSCNAFFYEVGDKLDAAALGALASEVGLGAATGSELRDPPGVIPPPPSPGAPRTARPLMNAIGHGDYLVTLLGLARAYAAIANGGCLVELHVVRGVRGRDGALTPAAHRPPLKLPLEPASLTLVRSALTDAVAADYGRAHSLALAGYPFAGKTGGADSPPRGHPDDEGDGKEQDSWFVGFAPPEHPTLLVAARLERVPESKPLGAGRVVSKIFTTLAPTFPQR